MSRPDALNLKAITDAIIQHNGNCDYPVREVRMNPFEVERLGWEEIRGIPIKGDEGIGTGRFRLVCDRPLPGAPREVVGIAKEDSVPGEPVKVEMT